MNLNQPLGSICSGQGKGEAIQVPVCEQLNLEQNRMAKVNGRPRWSSSALEMRTMQMVFGNRDHSHPGIMQLFLVHRLLMVKRIRITSNGDGPGEQSSE